MRFVNRIAGAVTLSMAMMIGWGDSAPVQAAYTVNLLQQGSDVVANGSGTIDLTGLSFVGNFAAVPPAMTPLIAYIVTGSTDGGPISHYSGVSGPTNFGSGFLTDASSGTGDLVGILGSGNELLVPAGFASGSPVSDTATYVNQTFSSLDATPGSYTWTWGSGSDDSFTLNVGPVAVPEPSSFALLALPLGVFMLLAARHIRATGNS